MANLVGKILQDRFRVDAFVASGGMSVVYRVWDLERNVPLAMKVLHIDLADDPSILKRFEREARALKKLAHPNIVSFYGLYQTLDFCFLLEHFVDGPSLKQILQERQGAPMQAQEALIYLKALSAALGYAHKYGVVHCDVKPGNVMIDRGGNIFLTDFGVARHAESTTTTLGAAGTPAYIAPEQIRADPVTPATDVYALGVLLYEMLTGRRPFVGNESGTDSSSGTAAERVRIAHLRLAPPDPRAFNPEIPEPVAQLILQALDKDPSERFSSTATLFEAVCDALGVRPFETPDHVAPPKIDRPVIQPEEPLIAPVGFLEQVLDQVRRQPLWLVGCLIPIILLLCAGVTMFTIFPSAGGLFATDTPTPTLTYTPTRTPLPTPTELPTAPPTLAPTATKMPTPMPPPTYTPQPTYTKPPTQAPIPEAKSFFVANNRRFKIEVWIDGVYLGVLEPGQYVTVDIQDWGTYSFKWCNYKSVPKQCNTASFPVQHAKEVVPLK